MWCSSNNCCVFVSNGIIEEARNEADRENVDANQLICNEKMFASCFVNFLHLQPDVINPGC